MTPAAIRALQRLSYVLELMFEASENPGPVKPEWTRLTCTTCGSTIQEPDAKACAACGERR